MFLGYFDDWRDGMETYGDAINEITANSAGAVARYSVSVHGMLIRTR